MENSFGVGIWGLVLCFHGEGSVLRGSVESLVFGVPFRFPLGVSLGVSWEVSFGVSFEGSLVIQFLFVPAGAFRQKLLRLDGANIGIFPYHHRHMIDFFS